jgi:anti-anti-sigma factor
MTRALPVWPTLPDHGPDLAVGKAGAMPSRTLNVRSPAQLTAANRDSFGQQVGAALNDHQSIELDLAHTTFMDCAGLGALIALHKLTRARHGALRVVNPTPPVRRLFALVEAGRLFEVVPPTDAQDHFSREPARGSCPHLEAVVGGTPYGAIPTCQSFLCS